jgi:O-antigen ligase
LTGRITWRAGLTWRTAYVVAVPIGAGILIAVLPSLALKAVVCVGVAGLFAAVELARRGHVLDPAWVIVAQLFLIAPVGVLVNDFDLDVSAIVVLNVLFLPFLATAIAFRAESRPGLLHIAPLALLALVGAASITWSSEPAIGTEKLAVFLVNGLLPAATLAVFYSATKRIRWGLIAAFGFVYALAILTIGTGWTDDVTRLTIFDQNPIEVARITMSVAVVVLFGPFRVLAKAAMAPVIVTAGLMTLSLGPLVGLGAGVLAGSVEILRLARRDGRRTILGWTALTLALGFTCIVLLSGVLYPLIARVVNDPNVTSRADYLAASGPLFMSSPLVGIGFGGLASTGLHEYPHNLPAEMLVELGLVGAAIVLAWVVLALRGALGSPLMVALVVTTGVFTLFSGSLASQTVFWLYSTLAVAMLAATRARPPRAVTVAATPPAGAPAPGVT